MNATDQTAGIGLATGPCEHGCAMCTGHATCDDCPLCLLLDVREVEHGACDHPGCGVRAEYRTCDDCGYGAWIIDCGHMSQPRPIAAGRSDGSELHRTFCAACADGPPLECCPYHLTGGLLARPCQKEPKP